MAQRVVSFAFLIGLFFSVYPTYVIAESTSVAERLNAINKTIDRINTDLSLISGQALNLKAEQRQLNDELNKLKFREKNINQEFQTIAEQLKAAQINYEATKRDHAELINASSNRLLTAYIQARNRGSFFALAKTQALEWHKMAFYTTRVRQSDLYTLQRIKNSANSIKDEQMRLAQLVNNREKVRAQLSEQRSKVTKVANTKARVLADLEKQKKIAEQRINELEAQSLRLETVMVSLTEGEDTFYGKERLPGSYGGEKKLNFVGAGLMVFKGKLSYPVVDAKLLSPQNGPGLVKSKGLNFQTGLDSEVVAIATGQVIFSGRMPGYENTIIMDHGQRSYSVYSKLANLGVKKGEIVAQGKTLGRVSQSSDGSSGQLYLEIRESGKAVDPTKYFK